MIIPTEKLLLRYERWLDYRLGQLAKEADFLEKSLASWQTTQKRGL